MTKNDEPRMARPGKFEGQPLVAAYVYELSLAGCDDETGEADAGGWYGLLTGTALPVCATYRIEHLDGEVSPAEARWLDCAGFIVSEDSQGFVTVDRFETVAGLVEAWSELEEAVSDLGEGL